MSTNAIIDMLFYPVNNKHIYIIVVIIIKSVLIIL